MTTAQTAQRCPACGAALARLAEEPPWCPECEWNLETVRERPDSRRTRRQQRIRLAAFELNRQLLREFGGAPPARPKATRTRLFLACASVALLVFDLALVVLGILLLIHGPGVVHVLGFVLALIGIECRIRFPKADLRIGRVSARDAPSLIAAIDQARNAVGGPAIAIVQVSSQWNASCGRTGLRRRTVLMIGLPLWGALGPEARMALLGHEIGHLVNGDPTTSFTTQPALTTFARLATIFNPRGLFFASDSIWQWVAAPFVYTIFWPVYASCRWAHLALSRVAARDHQRAEAYADVLARRLGGTSGAGELARTLLFDRVARRAVHAAAREGSADPQSWRAAALAAIEARATDERSLEQMSLRYDASGYGSHPPAGLRHRLFRSWPTSEPAIGSPQQLLDAADVELRRHYERVRRSIANSPLL
ncbi:MAG TPA: M48 family metalloprotease [Jatrophihabitans sp.]|nr:M48 family metalloprotease [Jatrophihabitans sp.]